MGSLVISVPHQPGIFGSERPHESSNDEYFPTSAPFATPDRPRARSSTTSDIPMTDAAPRAPSSNQIIQQEVTSDTLPNNTTPNASQHVPTQDAASTASTSIPSPAQSVQSTVQSMPGTPNRIKVRDLAHIQSFATEDSSAFSPSSTRQRNEVGDVGPQYEISSMPVTDIIEMVAGLLTKITTTNDRQHEHLHRQMVPIEGTAGLSQQTTSVLAFHGKNVPSITILSYLARIHKYCPTTYEVFLSLLVYFDRMTERVNSLPMQRMNQQSFNENAQIDLPDAEASPAHAQRSSSGNQPLGSLSATEIASSHQPTNSDQSPTPPASAEQSPEIDPFKDLSHFFVVDSYNIHRLVIAGVTCASKFFSDIFYTNSRYAKVGGLPLPELNHLELQFLLLNDFRLAIPAEEMEAYGTMLVEFYAREVVAQKQGRTRAMEGMYPAS
ncbi:MAG: hypothetical protein M1820_006497 [Bogoriella megaspora]|nr:MAG: hypothetical protein M1820_006497 [Bogoriella megaspora]